MYRATRIIYYADSGKVFLVHCLVYVLCVPRTSVTLLLSQHPGHSHKPLPCVFRFFEPYLRAKVWLKYKDSLPIGSLAVVAEVRLWALLY